MAKKLIKEKAAIPKMTLGIATRLMSFLPQFRTINYADHQRIGEVLKTLQIAEEQRNEIIKSYFKEQNLPEIEIIDSNHPLARDLFEKINKAETELNKSATAKFTLEELNTAVLRLELSYSDREFLMFWLVK